MKKSSDNWLKIAERDLKLAQMSLREKEPMGVVFHMHAAIEKLLLILDIQKILMSLIVNIIWISAKCFYVKQRSSTNA